MLCNTCRYQGDTEPLSTEVRPPLPPSQQNLVSGSGVSIKSGNSGQHLATASGGVIMHPVAHCHIHVSLVSAITAVIVQVALLLSSV